MAADRVDDLPATTVSTSSARSIVSRHWGFDGECTSLPAEADENFRVDSPEGDFLLKVVPPDEPREVTELVTDALVHVGSSSEGILVQRVIPNHSGDLVTTIEGGEQDGRRARLTTFVGGTMLRSLTVDRETRERMGGLLARLTQALASFNPPAADRDLAWDITHAGRMREMLDQLEPNPKRRKLAACLDEFERHILPRLSALPAQVVHNDLTRDNVILTPEGELAVIDFGDVVRTQRISDVAVAMADHLADDPDPMGPALDFLRGYLAVEDLQPEELALLPGLIRTRTVMRIVAGEWKVERYPENREYLGRNVEYLSRVFAHFPDGQSPADSERFEALVGNGA